MAGIELTSSTTQVFIVSVFIAFIIYYNYVLIKSSLDLIFWATIVSIPLIGLKNSTSYISLYLHNWKYLKRPQIVIFLLIWAKNILFDKQLRSIIVFSSVLFYIALEKVLEKSSNSNYFKIVIVMSVCAYLIFIGFFYVMEEIKYITATFNIKGFITEKNMQYITDVLAPNIDMIIDKIRQNQDKFIQFEHCGIDIQRINFEIFRNFNLAEFKKIMLCLANEYKNQLITIAATGRPWIIKAIKKGILYAESSFGVATRLLTFASTVYIMTKQSVQPIQVADAFLSLIDDTGYLSKEFKDILESLIVFNFQKIIVSCLSTYVAFSIFSMKIVMIPTILSVFTVLIPGAPSYFIPLIGMFELISAGKPYWYILCFIIFCNRLKKYYNSLVTLKVSFLNSK